MNLENSLYKVIPGYFQAEIELPTSKSYSNRALIIGAIRGNGYVVENLSNSTDVETLINCLQKIGLKFLRDGNRICFHNSFPLCESDLKDEVINLYTGDGGTTNRFLVALLSLGRKVYRLIPSEKMSERPIDELLNPLRELHVQFNTNVKDVWIELKGPASLIQSSQVRVDCGKSTQFASALMLAFAHLPLTVIPENIQASETYLEMTKAIIQESFTSNILSVPVDFSSLSYPFVLALIKGEVLITNCKDIDPYQADAALVDLAIGLNADVVWSPRGLKITSKNVLKTFKVDGSRFPDLVPALVFLASQIEGESVISNLSVLRHKESDRVKELINILKAFEVSFDFDEEQAEIKIRGVTKASRPITFVPARDHRMVMTAFLFMKALAGGFLGNTDSVDKSFPKFFQIMNGVAL